MDLLKPSYASGYAKNASQSAHPNLWDGLVGAWMPSLGVTGKTLRDVSGNGNHGTLTFMAAASDWVATSKGLALDFDGVNDYVNIGDKISAPKNLSIFSWVKCDNTFYFPIVSKGIGAVGQREYQLWVYQGAIGGGVAHEPTGDVDVVYGSVIGTNKWFYLGMTWDGSVLSVYRNGKLDASVLTSIPFIDDRSSTLKIGLNQNNIFANGKITNTSIYNRALSPSEIKHLYVDSLAPFRTKKRTVVRVPAAIPAATVVGSIKKPTTIIKPSYQAGYARNASESENPNLWDGLVGAWMPSLGVTGETLRDVSGNGNHGTLTGMDAATDWVATSKGLALDFDGSDDYVQSDYAIESLGALPRTLSSHFKIRNTSNQTIAGFGNSSSSQWFYILIFQGKWYFSGYANDYSISQPLPVVGQHHISMSYDSSDVRFYLDGLLIAQFAKTLNTQSGVLRVGRRATFNDFPLNGQVSSVMLHKRALSTSEIKQLYVDSLAPFRKKQRVSVAVPAGITFKPYWAKQSTQISGLLK